MMARPKETVVFRCDAGPKRGMGHVMRCFSIAQALHDRGGQAVFVCAGLTDFLRKQLFSEGIKLHELPDVPFERDDLEQTKRLIGSHYASWLVVDSYETQPDYFENVASSNMKIMLVHDYEWSQSTKLDLILNQNPHADVNLYTKVGDAKKLLGLDYVVMRRDYRCGSSPEREIGNIPIRVLVTMGGGASAKQAICKALSILEEVQSVDLEICVLAPKGVEFDSTASRHTVRCLDATQNLKDEISKCGFALSASGTTAYELAYQGIPSAWLVIAENQRPIAEKLSSMGYGLNFGFVESIDEGEAAKAVEGLITSEKRCRSMAEKGRSLVDGLGADRVLDEMGIGVVSVRAATHDDCRMIWEWSSDPVVRNASFTSEAIPWKDHQKWYEGKMNNQNCFFYIGVSDSAQPLGQIRYEVSDECATVSTAVSAEYRGRGLGSRLIRRATETFFNESSTKQVIAYIKKNNEQSLRAFMKAGFKMVNNSGSAEDKWQLVLNRGENNV